MRSFDFYAPNFPQVGFSNFSMFGRAGARFLSHGGVYHGHRPSGLLLPFSLISRLPPEAPMQLCSLNLPKLLLASELAASSQDQFHLIPTPHLPPTTSSIPWNPPPFLPNSANHLQPFFDTSCLRILPHLDKTSIFGILSSRSTRRHPHDSAWTAPDPNQPSRHIHINYP
jgi:hypothetical protein